MADRDASEKASGCNNPASVNSLVPISMIGWSEVL